MNCSNPIREQAIDCQKNIADALVEAAAAQNIQVDRNTISMGMLRAGAIVVNSAVEGLASVDPIQYEQGVLTNFVYTDVGGRNLPPGFYAVTTHSSFVQPGPIPIRMQYSQGGELIAAVPGRAIITSLRVPRDVRPFVRTGIQIGTAFPPSVADWQEVDWDTDPPTIRYYTECSNGQYSCSDPEPYVD